MLIKEKTNKEKLIKVLIAAKCNVNGKHPDMNFFKFQF